MCEREQRMWVHLDLNACTLRLQRASLSVRPGAFGSHLSALTCLTYKKQIFALVRQRRDYKRAGLTVKVKLTRLSGHRPAGLELDEGFYTSDWVLRR